jgi:hypothetical protein
VSVQFNNSNGASSLVYWYWYDASFSQHFGIHGFHNHHLTNHHTDISPLFPLYLIFVLNLSFSPRCQALDFPAYVIFLLSIPSIFYLYTMNYSPHRLSFSMPHERGNPKCSSAYYSHVGRNRHTWVASLSPF